MKEIVIVSGKGGTGKTSISASFAVLAENRVLVDADVDASDLHLILQPTVLETHNFKCGIKAEIDPRKCTGCGICQKLCRFKAVEKKTDSSGDIYTIEDTACEGCGVCIRFCPAEAVLEKEYTAGEWYSSDTRVGPMFHARMRAVAENSGKMVSLLRNKAKKTADNLKADYILIDGPPGVGCPVIASLTGADAAVIVTEPTVSGLHDLKRVYELIRFFRVPPYLIINKSDINTRQTEKIRSFAENEEIPVLGLLPWDSLVTAAQLKGKAVTEMEKNSLSETLRSCWNKIIDRI